jgi:propanol-preferring alcohol dehydrogenase
MKAMRLHAPGRPLELDEVPEPTAGPGEVLLEVSACGVCRTDLHLLDGEVDVARPPVTLGHQIVGRVIGGDGFDLGTRVGVPWLGWVDGTCRFCTSGRENLCPDARFTGRDIDGGYAERAVADARFCFALPGGLDDLHVAPLLCGGLIGYRALRLAGDARRIGLYGFGSSAHLICQVARWQGREVFAFTRPGDAEGQAFARSLGACWAGGSDERPPEPLDAALIFAPAGPLVVEALRSLDRGGVVVCAGIHMSDIPAFPYELLWEERQVRSVANLTRRDGVELLEIAARANLRTTISVYDLERTNEALDDLRHGRFEGSAVVRSAVSQPA